MYGIHRRSLSPIVPSMEAPGAAPDADDPAAYNLVVTNAGDTATQFTAAVTPLTHVKDLSQCQDLRINVAAPSASILPMTLPFIDCDSNATTLRTLLAQMAAQDISCGVFYSSTNAQCALAPGAQWTKNRIPNMFTVTSLGAALQLASTLDANTPLRGTISAGPRNGASSGKSGGLIALYAALGVFAFILLILLFGGLIRVTRHPERYNAEGTGEERARGLARAMLDSVPLVRVDNSRAAAPRTGAPHDDEARVGDDGHEKMPDEPHPPLNSHNRRGSSSSSGSSGSGGSSGSTNGDVLTELTEGSAARPPGGSTSIQGSAQGSAEVVARSPDTGPIPSPAIISAPAPTKVNTYAFSGGVRTPQRTPGLTPGTTPAVTPGHTPTQTSRSVSSSTASLSADAPPKYSTDGFPFPIMHEANTSLQTIDEHKIANKPQVSRSPLQAASTNAGQSPAPVPGSSRHASGAASFAGRTPRSLELPSQPPARRRPAQTRAASETAPKPESGASTAAASAQSSNASPIGVYVNADEDMCAICFDDFHAGELLRALPCGHYFHATCVDPWLLKSSSKCPLCRTDLRKTIKNEQAARSAAPGHGHSQGHSHARGHTFYFVKRRIRRVSESLRGDARPDARPLHAAAAETSLNVAAAATSRSRSAPSLHRSNTAPAHRLLRLLPITPSTAHLLRSSRQPEREAVPADGVAPNTTMPAHEASAAANEAAADSRDPGDATAAATTDAVATAEAAATADAATAAATAAAERPTETGTSDV